MSKLLESRSPWGVLFQLPSGQYVSILGEIPNPIQVVDRCTSEALLACQRSRNSRSSASDLYACKLRMTTLDGAASNTKLEREGQKLDRPGTNETHVTYFTLPIMEP